MPFSLTDPEILASLLTLTALEIVLGIDNVVFISVVISRLPEPQRLAARRIGIGLALIFRIILLLGIFWIIGLTKPIVTIYDQSLSWRDVILLAGGLFLIAKATYEIHNTIEGGGEAVPMEGSAGFASVILQVIVIDLVFSVDSIITAIGIAKYVEVMIAAVVISMFVMYVASGAVSGFIERHPTTKMLAMSFLLLIGAALVADGLQFHIPRGYIYFAMLFAGAVEAFNILAGKKRRPPRNGGRSGGDEAEGARSEV